MVTALEVVLKDRGWLQEGRLSDTGRKQVFLTMTIFEDKTYHTILVTRNTKAISRL